MTAVQGTEETFFTRDRNFYRGFFGLMGMLVLQNIIVLSVNLLDNVMLGSYGETALSGAAAVNQIQFLFQQLAGGFGEGMVVLTSQYWGQKNTEPIKAFSSIALRAALLVAVIFFALVSVFPHGALQLFTTDENIIGEGMSYLGVIKYTYLIFAVTSVLLATLRSVETVRIALATSVVALLINGLLNYMLIFGRLGAPELGARGAAIATLIARIVELVIVIFYVAKIDKKLQLKLRDFLQTNTEMLRDYIRVCWPIILVAGLWGASTALQTVILGHMNASAIAASSMASTLSMILKVAAVGASSSAGILIGKTIGEDGFHKIHAYVRTLQVIFIGVGLFIGMTLFFIRTPILSLYNLTPETTALANQFLLVLCVTNVGMAYQMPVLGGVVRGGGDTKFIMKNDLISIWGIVIPLSLLAAFVFHWSPVVVYVCLNSDQVFKCFAAFFKVNSYNWIRKLTR